MSFNLYAQDFWTKTGGPEGGSIKIVRSHPDGEIFLVTNYGYVHVSTDDGLTWTRLSSEPPNANDMVIDMGCGTGAFALYAAKKCRKIYAVDVSKAMLEYIRQKSQKAGLNNIDFCQPKDNKNYFLFSVLLSMLKMILH